jgi:hypothetical protein
LDGKEKNEFAMSNEIVPAEIASFVLEKIDSVGHLELLLLLRSTPNRSWSVRELAARLYITEQQTTELIVRLWTHGFITSQAGEPPLYQYHPTSIEIRNKVDRLAELYAKHSLPLTNLIYAKPKIRVQQFADAFKIRKD